MLKHIVIGVFVILFTTANSWGVDYIWTGGGGNSVWENNSNWDVGGSYPDDGTDTATINLGGVSTAPAVNTTLAGLTIAATSTVAPAAGVSLNITGLVTCDGTLTASAAGITLGGGITGSGTFNASTGTTTVNVGIDIGTFSDNDGILAIAGDTVLYQSYTFHDVSINAGIFNTNGQSTIIEQDISGVGGLTAGGSQITIGRDMTFAGVFTANTSTIVFDTALNAAINGYTFNNVTINKTGTATFATGTSINTLLVTDSGGVTFSGTLAGTTVTLNGTTGDIAFQGNATIQSLNTANAGYNVLFTGASNTITNDVDFINTGTVTLGDDGDSCTFNGGLATAGNASNPGTTNIGGTVATSNDQIDLGPVSITVDSTINSGTAALNMASVTCGGNNLLISSTGSVACAGAVTTGGGNYTVSAASDFDNTGGTIDASAAGNVSITASGAVNMASAISTDGVGTVSLTSTGGAVTIAANVDLGTGALSCNANNGINQTGGRIIAGGSSSFSAGAGVITLNSGTNDFTGAVSLSNTGANAVDVTDTNAILLGTVNVGTGTLTINATGTITQSGATTISQAAGAGAASFTAGANVITLTNANDFTGAVGLSSTGASVSVNDINDITLSTPVLGANTGITAIAGGVLTLPAGAISTGTGNIDLQSNGGVLAISGPVSTTSGTINLQSSAAMTIADNITTTLAGGNLTITGVGVTQTAGTISIAGTTTVNGGAGVITLNSGTNDFTGAVNLTNTGANAVEVTDTNAIVLGTVNTANNLTVNAVGITQNGGGVTVTGTSSFNGGAGVITLSTAGNDFTGAVSLTNTGANAVEVTDTNAILLGTVNVGTGTLTINATGTITQSGATTISQAAGAGAASFTAGANVITLTNANDFTGAVGLSSTGANVSVNDINDITLSTPVLGANTGITAIAGGVLTLPAGAISTGTGNIDLQSNGGVLAISGPVSTTSGTINLQSSAAMTIADNITTTLAGGNLTITGVGVTQTAGTISIAGTTTVNGGAGVITLNSGTNDFTGAVNLSNTGANAVEVTDTNAIVLGTVNTANNLTVNAVGITQNGGGVTVTGTSSFNGGAGVITLSTAGNDFTGAVSLTNTGANAVEVTDTNAIVLGTVNTANNLTVNAVGITQNGGGVTVTGTSSFNGGAGVITLSTAGNDFTGAVSLTNTGANAVQVTDTNAIVLGTVNTANNLTVNAVGITQNGGGVTVTGTSSFNGGAGVITLSTAGNDFTGAVSLTNTGANAVEVTDTNAIVLGTVNTANNLTVNAVGITQNGGGVTVTGTSSFNGGAGVITLSTAGNDFTGAVSLTNTGANAVEVTDTNAIVLGTVNTANNLTVNAVGITQNGGGVTVTGTSSFNGGAGVITLSTAGNDFTGAVSLTNTGANAVEVTDTNAIVLGTVNTANNLTVNAVGITQNGGGVTVTGTSSFNGGAGVITLSTAGNDFTGAVNLTNTGANAVEVTDTNAIVLGTVNTANNLTVNAVGITQNGGGVTVTGTSSFNGGAGVITLSTAGNDFTGAVNLTNTGANAVEVTDTNAIVLGTVNTANNLTVNAVGITQNGGGVTVTGTSSFNGGAGVITLSTAGNDFTGAVGLSSTGASVSVNDINDLTLSTPVLGANTGITAIAGGVLTLPAGAISTGTGNIDLQSNGGVLAISGPVSTTSGTINLQSSAAMTIADNITTTLAGGNLTITGVGVTQTAGTISIAGTTTVNGGAGVITLNSGTNDFTGAVNLTNTGANAVEVTDTNAIVLGTVNTANNLTVNAVGITQNGGGVTVTGTSSFNGGAGVITLTTAGNDFTGAVSLTNSGANAVEVTDTNAIVLGTVNTANNLTVNAVGITQNGGGVTVTGTSSFNGGAGVITLTTAGNDFTGAVSLTNTGANAVEVTDTNAIVLGTVNTANNLTVNAVGITQNGGGVTVTGTSSFNGGAGVITLSTAGNDFTGAVNLTNTGANAVEVTDTNAIVLGTVNTANNLTVNAVGITQNGGGVTVTGTSSFNGGAGVITLSTAGNDFTGAVSLTNTGANAVEVTDTNAIVLGTVNTANNLTVNAVGITQNGGGVTVTGTSSFNGGAGVITLTTAGNDFTGAVSLTNTGANAVEVTDTNAIVLGTVNTANNLTVNAVGITQNGGGVTVTGTSSFNGGAGVITLTTAGNDFTGAVSLSNTGANAVEVTDTNAILLGTVNVGTGTLTINATGTITQSGATTISQAAGAGAASFTAGANAITLTNANEFTGTFNVVSGSSVSANDINSLIIGTVSVTGTAALSAGTTLNDDGAGTPDITAAAVNLDAAGGIGNTQQIQLSGVDTVDADDTGNGAVNISNTADAAVTVNSITTGNNTINYIQTGNQTLLLSSVSTADGTITVNNTGNDITAGSVTAGGTGDIQISTNISGNIITGTLDAAGDLITLDSAGNINDDGAGTPDITAAAVNLDAVSGIGGTTPLELSDVTTINADNSGPGNIDIDNSASGAVNVASMTTGAAGTIAYDQSGNQILTLNLVTAADGNIDITNTGGAGNILLGDIDADTANDTVTINAGGSITDGTANDSASDVTAANINLIAAVGGIGQDANGSVDVNAVVSFSADTDAGDDGNITIDDIIGAFPLGAVTAGSGNVLFTSVGDITDANGAAVNISANSLIMDAVNGIGSADSIETSVDFLDLDNTTLGNIDITETNAVSINQVDQDAPGTVNITAGGDLTIVAGQSSVTSIAGTVTIDAGVNTIHFDEDVVTVGGDVIFQSSAEIGDNVSVNTGAGAGGNITLASVDDTFILTLIAGTGDVTINGALGSGTRINGLNISSAAVVDINNTVNTDTSGIAITATGTINMSSSVSTINGGTVTITNGALLTLEDGCDMNLDGAFLQNGAGEVVSGGGITTSNDNVTFNRTVYFANSTDNISFSTGLANLVFSFDIHIYVPSRTITFLSDFSCGNFILYSGNINFSGNTLSTNQDFIAFGSAYDDAIGIGVTDLYSYDNPARTDNANFPGNVLADPKASLVTSIPLPVPINFTEADYAGSFSDLIGSTIDVTGNFYVNGSNMTATNNWTLTIPANDSALAGFAEAYNMSVSYSQAAAGWVAAGENVTEAVAASCSNWDFTTNTLQNGVGALADPSDWDKATGNVLTTPYPADSDNAGCVTVYDNVIRIEIGPSGTANLFENSNDEISRAIDNVNAYAVQTNSGTVRFDGSFTDRDCTTSTVGAGDLAVFYLRVADADSWNTDASGTGAGNAISTDMGRPVALPAAPNLPATKAVVPDIYAPKGTGDHSDGFTVGAEIYMSLIDNHKNRISHYPAGTPFTGVTDHCRPVVAMIETGRDNNSATQYNWHNYFQIKYSEPVDIGSDAAFVSAGTAYNVRATQIFTAAAEYGGYIHETVADTTVTMEGYFSYPGTFKSGTKDPAEASPCVSSMFRNAPNAYGSHGLRVYAAGYSDGTTWTGFMYDVSEPNGQIATISANSFITDANNNAIDNRQFTIQDDGANPVGCDWIQPSISPYSGDPSNVREVMTLDSDSDGLIDRLEFHILDNNDLTVDLLQNTPNGLWDSDNDHPETDDFNTNGFGIRESSIQDIDSFAINVEGATPVVPAGGFTFTTDVDNALFNPSPLPAVNKNNDTYFALTFDDSALSLDYLSKDDFSYDSSVGRITDLAGNLLRSVALANCMERVPPTIFYTIGSAGSNKVYVKFSEYVFNEGAETTPINQADFSIAGGAYTISSVTPLSTKSFGLNIGVLDAFFILDNPISADDLLVLQIDPDLNEVSDAFDTRMDDADLHRISDFAVGLVEPVWAADTYNADNSYYDSRALRDFTGGGRLLATDITLEARLSTTSTAIPLTLFYDADISSSARINNFWLPTLFTGYNTTANSSARGLNPFSVNGALKDFLIPGSDSEVEAGNDIEFIFNLGGLYAGYLKDPTDPRTISPWKIPIKGVKKQRAGVTILNNVINPREGEKAILQYDLEKTGTVTINIFSLSGDVVKTLFKGRQTSGSYSFTWDGKNTGGRAVARGIYFIRVVGPDVDEYRKVMVVK